MCFQELIISPIYNFMQQSLAILKYVKSSDEKAFGMIFSCLSSVSGSLLTIWCPKSSLIEKERESRRRE